MGFAILIPFYLPVLLTILVLSTPDLNCWARGSPFIHPLGERTGRSWYQKVRFLVPRDDSLLSSCSVVQHLFRGTC
jgi:hypothetical protein